MVPPRQQPQPNWTPNGGADRLCIWVEARGAFMQRVTNGALGRRYWFEIGLDDIGMIAETMQTRDIGLVIHTTQNTEMNVNFGQDPVGAAAELFEQGAPRIDFHHYLAPPAVQQVVYQGPPGTTIEQNFAAAGAALTLQYNAASEAEQVARAIARAGDAGTGG